MLLNQLTRESWSAEIQQHLDCWIDFPTCIAKWNVAQCSLAYLHCWEVFLGDQLCVYRIQRDFTQIHEYTNHDSSVNSVQWAPHGFGLVSWIIFWVWSSSALWGIILLKISVRCWPAGPATVPSLSFATEPTISGRQRKSTMPTLLVAILFHNKCSKTDIFQATPNYCWNETSQGAIQSVGHLDLGLASRGLKQ